MDSTQWILCIILVAGGGVWSQDCDSFVCVREYHKATGSGTASRNVFCSATQNYVSCLRQSTVICTSLTIEELTEVATLIKSHAACDSASQPNGTSIALLTGLMVILPVLQRLFL